MQPDFETLEAAPTTGACIVIGWQSDAADRRALRAALGARDRDRLNAFYRENALAVVELFAESPFAPDPEELAELKVVGLREDHLERVRKARVRYTVRTNASRNDLSAELQKQLWVVVGVLTDGLCEDPQEGEFIDASEEEDAG
jgi:hypothetical protein